MDRPEPRADSSSAQLKAGTGHHPVPAFAWILAVPAAKDSGLSDAIRILPRTCFQPGRQAAANGLNLHRPPGTNRTFLRCLLSPPCERATHGKSTGTGHLSGTSVGEMNLPAANAFRGTG